MKYLPAILLAITLLCGTVGYIQSGQGFYESLLNSFSFLVLNGSLSPTNPLIEIGRWLGIVFASSIVYTIVKTALSVSSETLRVKAKARKSDSVAIHGDGIFADCLTACLGKKAIRSKNALSFNAPCQVLIFKEDERALEFYSRNHKLLEKANEVYICFQSMQETPLLKNNTYSFSMASVCASLYWEKNPATHTERIAIIGSGSYAESIFSQALLVNLYSIEGGIEYLVYGDFGEYCQVHCHLAEVEQTNKDRIVFKHTQWFDCIGELQECTRIILCDSSRENLKIATELHALGVTAHMRENGLGNDIKPIHMRCDSKADLDLILSADILTFGTSDELATSAIVLQQHQHDAGKICHIAYLLGKKTCNLCARQNDYPTDQIQDNLSGVDISRIRKMRLQRVAFDVCLHCKKFNDDWNAMNEFTRASNYAVASHDVQKKKLLADVGITKESGKTFYDLSQNERDRLQEIEHIRWCRFHYLNNWQYGPGQKNDTLKSHPLLIPYSMLERSVKDMDADSYLTIFYRNAHID